MTESMDRVLAAGVTRLQAEVAQLEQELAEVRASATVVACDRMRAEVEQAQAEASRLRKALHAALALVEAVADQQAMPDESWRDAWEVLRREEQV